MARKMTPVGRAAHNFIQKYGKHALRQMILDFECDVPHSEIGRRLSVTRERVRQWQNLFGKKTTGYMIHPDIDTLARKRKDGLGEKPEVSCPTP